MYKKTSAILAVALLIVSAVAAQAQSGQRYEQTIQLEPTALGVSDYDAAGLAKKAGKGEVEQFALRVVANCPDDTIFVVRATDQSGKEFDVGTITTLFNSGSLVLRSSVDPSPIFPLGNIRSIAVYERRGAILEGVFPR